MRAVAATCSDSETWASGRILVGPGLSGLQSPSASMCHRWLFGAGTSFNSSVSYLPDRNRADRSEEHTSELQSLMRTSYAVFCLKKKKQYTPINHQPTLKVISTAKERPSSI